MSQASYRDIRGHLARREAFTGNSMSARRGDPWINPGRLAPVWAAHLRADENDPGVEYVVFSYDTPIAWVRRDGVAVIPLVRYSRTTSRHQNLARTELVSLRDRITKIGANT